jgi:hypothetical protein
MRLKDGKHPAVAARHCWNWEFVRDWLATRPVVDRPLVPGSAKALSVGLSNAYFKSLGLPTLIDGC